MPKLDIESFVPKSGTGYPKQYAAPFAGRWQRRLGDALGMQLLGANYVTLDPGAWSSLRHWHRDLDELLVMLSGEAVLVEDAGETVLRPGDIVAWPRGVEEGHHLQNRSEAPCSFIAVSAGDEAGDICTYSDIDMLASAQGFTHKDGTSC